MPTYPYTLASALYFQNGHYNAIDDRKFMADFVTPGVHGAEGELYNQIPNPSFESGAAPWVNVGGTTGQYLGNSVVGSYSMRIQAAASGNGVDWQNLSVSNGQRYYVRCNCFVATGQASLRVSDGTPTQIAIASSGVLTNTAVTLTLEFVANATAQNWRIRLLTNGVFTHDLFYDCVLIHEIPSTGITIPYADGNSPGYQWGPAGTGTQNNSPTYTDSAFNVDSSGGIVVNVAPGSAYVPGGNIADQGIYRVRQDLPATLTLNSNPTANPRLDQIIVRVMDDSADDSGYNQARVEGIPGNPTPGASLDNRLGAANLDALTENSKSYLLLADALVVANPGLLATLRDRRMWAGRGGELVARTTGVANWTVFSTSPTNPNMVFYTPFLTYDGSLMRFRFHAPGAVTGSDGEALSIGIYEVPSGGTYSSPIAVMGQTRNGNRHPVDIQFLYAPPKGRYQYVVGAWKQSGAFFDCTIYAPFSFEIWRT